MRYLQLFLFAALLALVSCNESDDEPQSGGNPESNIDGSEIMANDSIELKMAIDGGSERAWSADAFTLAGSTSFTSCRLDDVMQFNADGTYVYDGGEVLCGAEDDQFVKTGTWEIDFENQRILFDLGTSNQTAATIIGLSDNELRVQGTYMMLDVRGIYSSEE